MRAPGGGKGRCLKGEGADALGGDGGCVHMDMSRWEPCAEA